MIHLQSKQREVDVGLIRVQYTTDLYLLNDFIDIGNYNLRIISAVPEKALTYTTMLKTFDTYTWTFIVISVLSVLITMVAIEETWGSWMGTAVRASIHQCRLTTYVWGYLFINMIRYSVERTWI